MVAAQNCAEVVAAQSRAEATIADSLQQSEDGAPVAQVAAGAFRLVPALRCGLEVPVEEVAAGALCLVPGQG